VAALETPTNHGEMKPGSSVYSEYIAEQVAREDARKESLEGRGQAVLTTAGAISTLLFGLAAFNIDSKHFTLPGSAKVLLIVALSFFFVSALAAILTNFPLDYEEVRPADLREAVDNRWLDSEVTAERMTSITRLKVLASARDRNGLKAHFLYASICLQGVAVACLAAAVGLIL
jgi:hypothetical protein